MEAIKFYSYCSSTVTLWWAKVSHFFGSDFLGSLRPRGARMAGKGGPPCPSPALPVCPISCSPRGDDLGGEQSMWGENMSGPAWAPSLSTTRRAKGPPEGAALSFGSRGRHRKKRKERRQGRVRIRMWKKEEEEECTQTKARGDRKGRGRGAWHLRALVYAAWHHRGPGGPPHRQRWVGNTFFQCFYSLMTF